MSEAQYAATEGTQPYLDLLAEKLQSVSDMHNDTAKALHDLAAALFGATPEEAEPGLIRTGGGADAGKMPRLVELADRLQHQAQTHLTRLTELGGRL
jgi:hypothetical protein